MYVSQKIQKEARKLGERARVNHDLRLCEDHLRQLEHHPTDDKFKHTIIYKEFEDLVRDHAANEDVDWETASPTVRDELLWEVREVFDETYYDPADTIQCDECLDENIDIRVDNPDAVDASEMIDGKNQSGHVDDDDDQNAWR